MIATKPRTLKAATEIAGTLGRPSKMPGVSYGISAHSCATGSRLALVEGSVCHGCYALKANYQYPSVKAAHAKRAAGLDHPFWVDAMVLLIERSGADVFRWHDSGDIQSLQHLSNIVAIAERLPSVRFWLPTREKAIVRDFQRSHGAFPPNLCVRVSAAMVDGAPPAGFANVSAVTSTQTFQGHACPAPQQGNKCLDCRACWEQSVHCVTYRQH
jgi:hypothetical protein